MRTVTLNKALLIWCHNSLHISRNCVPFL